MAIYLGILYSFFHRLPFGTDTIGLQENLFV
jgi:hypothetical protein